MINFYNWTISNIATWNKITFPKFRFIDQLRKLAEEIDEWKKAKDSQHKLEELADVFIASAGLTRFDGMGKIIGSFICYLLQIINAQSDMKDALKYAVNVKMKTNTERKFDEKGHHLPKI